MPANSLLRRVLDEIPKESRQGEQTGSHWGLLGFSPLGVTHWLNLNNISYYRFIFILVDGLTSNIKFPPTEDLITLLVSLYQLVKFCFMSPVIIYVIHIQIILINLMELKFLYGIIMWSLREPSDCVLMSIKAAEKLYFFHFKPVLSSKYKLYCHLNKYYVLECLLLDSRIFQCLGTIDIFCG